VRPNLTGAAVFHRGADGTLSRITAANAEAHANNLYATHKAAGTFPAWGIDFIGVINLSTALKWLDNYALSGTGPNDMTEYLVRVEQDEVLPKTTISCRLNVTTLLAEHIRIRIRGYGGERIITHDPMDDTSGYVRKEGNSFSTNEGFLNICHGSNLAVHLEKNITIDAGTWTFYPAAGGLSYIKSIVYVGSGNTLVMEAGSKLANYTNLPVENYLHYDYTAVVVGDKGAFEWRGGEISNILGHGNLVYCYRNGSLQLGVFRYWGQGITQGNTGDKIAVGEYHNATLYDPNDPRFAPAP
jgi:hypothetical protein